MRGNFKCRCCFSRYIGICLAKSSLSARSAWDGFSRAREGILSSSDSLLFDTFIDDSFSACALRIKGFSNPSNHYVRFVGPTSIYLFIRLHSGSDSNQATNQVGPQKSSKKLQHASNPPLQSCYWYDIAISNASDGLYSPEEAKNITIDRSPFPERIWSPLDIIFCVPSSNPIGLVFQGIKKCHKDPNACVIVGK